jgi:hypothetical protein
LQEDHVNLLLNINDIFITHYLDVITPLPPKKDEKTEQDNYQHHLNLFAPSQTTELNSSVIFRNMVEFLGRYTSTMTFSQNIHYV